jgi:hypothetical protein
MYYIANHAWECIGCWYINPLPVFIQENRLTRYLISQRQVRWLTLGELALQLVVCEYLAIAHYPGGWLLKA